MSEIIFNPPTSVPSLESQIDSMQTTLASLNQQVIILQEAVQERDQKIAQLEIQLSQNNQAMPVETSTPLRVDNTLTIVGALVNLYKFAFPPRKAG